MCQRLAVRPETIGWRVAISGMIDSTLARAARNEPSTPNGAVTSGTRTGGGVGGAGGGAVSASVMAVPPGVSP